MKISEQKLNKIIKESINSVVYNKQQINENFFDNFRRTKNVRDVSRVPGYEYFSFDNRRKEYYYMDDEGNKFRTGIGFDDTNMGRNWNIFNNEYKNNPTQCIPEKEYQRVLWQLKQWKERTLPVLLRRKERF